MLQLPGQGIYVIFFFIFVRFGCGPTLVMVRSYELLEISTNAYR